MHYIPEHIKNEDGTLSPWWKVKIYKDGKLFDETETEWSSGLYIKWICFKANCNAYIQYLLDRIFGLK